jgi:hypothetical protein
MGAKHAKILQSLLERLCVSYREWWAKDNKGIKSSIVKVLV